MGKFSLSYIYLISKSTGKMSSFVCSMKECKIIHMQDKKNLTIHTATPDQTHCVCTNNGLKKQAYIL